MAVLRRPPILTVPRAAAALSALLSLLILAACAGPAGGADDTGATDSSESSRAPASADRQRHDDVTALLDRWGAAVRSGDDDGVRAVLDPAADPAFVAREVARADVVATVPLSDFGYEILDEPETPVPPDLADAVDATEVWAPRVALRYAYADADTAPTRRDVSLVLARRGDEWRIVSDEERPQYGRTTWRGPWDFGPVETVRVQTGSTTSIVVGHPEQRAFLDAVAGDLPAAVAAVSDFVGEGWTRRGVVTVAGSDAEFTSLANGSTTPAVAASTIADPARGGLVTGQRVVFGASAPGRLTESTRRTVLQHELTHVALRAITGEGAPLWLLEGVADYSGYRGSGLSVAQIAPTLSAVVRVGGPPTVLPEDDDFGAGGSRGSIAYESAWSVASFVADRFGEARLLALYRALAGGPTDPTRLDAALSATLGLPTEAFLEEWGRWVAGKTAGPA
ncbi:peptidase MA family metallohydrolase [Rhodococcoides corynebacterioides]|uniref:Peptidase MA-like domain-containing protein n=1 Tax=Rhodococcoides corynebacterioides TaxID=53972 RepID=A0ABS7P2R8_9NOCA|nr:hypothetical protein [Rhodococcus corynebacterioides]MBY6366677.1 hypothetical protein [Rhodococcus corynebacterioides]MBY6408726.1 hypothetical protein [Rhodococcus corynebacterioides]